MGHFIQTKPKKTRPDPMSNQIGPKKKLTKQNKNKLRDKSPERSRNQLKIGRWSLYLRESDELRRRSVSE